MANPQTLAADTVLYCAAEPEGRMFPKGEQWPGDAWSANRGGKPVGEASVTQAMKDLIAAQDQIEALSAQLDRQTHSLAERTAERDGAASKVEALEQRAIAAETAQKTAEEAARGYMTERDVARADAKRFSDALEAAKSAKKPQKDGAEAAPAS